MFMLGSFTSGLFSGASDVFSLAHNYMKFKDDMRMRNAADEVQNNMLNSGAYNGTSGTGGLYGPDGTTGSSSGGDTSRPSGNSFDDDPELSKLPKLVKNTASALKGFGESGREGKAYGSTPTVTPSATTSAATDASKGAIGRLSDQPGPGETETAPAGHQSGSGLFDFLGSVGQRMRDYSTSHTNGEPPKPPTYLPPQTPPVPVGPQQPAPGAAPGALQGPMSGGVGYPGGPSLAMQQNPLGARIMSAINPAAGSVT